MPNRIIKESIHTSESIDALSLLAETMFYRLIVACDDNGRMDARLKILKAALFPLKDYTLEQVEKALTEIEAQGMIRRYSVDGRPYLYPPRRFKRSCSTA